MLELQTLSAQGLLEKIDATKDQFIDKALDISLTLYVLMKKMHDFFLAEI